MNHPIAASAAHMRALLACMLLTCMLGCAGRQSFSATFPANRTEDLTAALARAKQVPERPLPQVVVGVMEQPRGLFAYDLSAQRMLFRMNAEVTGVPIPAGPFVVVPEGDVVRVRQLSSGKTIHEISSSGMNLIGAASDGTVTAIVLSTGGSMGARSKLVVLQGEHVWGTREMDRQAGGPAVVGGYVFVPNNRVHLSVTDSHGVELSRIQVREDVASQAIAHNQEVYFGLLGIYHVDEETKRGASGGANYFKFKLKERLPGQPSFLPNTADPPPALNSAVHRVSLSFLPAMQRGKVGLVDDALYLLFYRQLFSLNAETSLVRWVHQTENDAVAQKSVPGGVLVVEDSGKLSAVNDQGSVQWTADMGIRPVVARVQATDLPRGQPGAAPAPLTMQLVDAALNPDARLVPSRAMAVALLAGLEDEDATAALIEICQERSTPERVRKVACVELAKRTHGSPAIASALARHADYLTDTKAPPVGPLAEAAMRSGDVSAVPLLLQHLSDPETPSEELPALMLALKELAQPGAAPAIADFLRLYHADANEPRMTDALLIAIDALKKLEGIDAQRTLDPIANDTFSNDGVRAAAAQALAQLTQTAPEADAAAQAPEATTSEADDDNDDEAEAVQAPPEHRIALHLNQAIRPIIFQLSECVRAHPKRPSNARLTVVLAGDGELLAVETLPVDLKSCMQPLLLGVPFPANKYGNRETVTTTIPR